MRETLPLKETSLDENDHVSLISDVQRVLDENQELRERLKEAQEQIRRLREGKAEDPLSALNRVIMAYSQVMRPIADAYDRDDFSAEARDDYDEHRRRLLDIETCRLFLMVVNPHRTIRYRRQNELVRFLARKEHLTRNATPELRERVEAKVRQRLIRQTEALSYFGLLIRKTEETADGGRRIALVPTKIGYQKADEVRMAASRS